MQQCKNTLNQICGGAALMAAAFIPVVFVSVSTLLIAFAYPQETLVSRKVRLNN